MSTREQVKTFGRYKDSYGSGSMLTIKEDLEGAKHARIAVKHSDGNSNSLALLKTEARRMSAALLKFADS